MSVSETTHGVKLTLDGDKRDYIVFRQGSGNTVEIYDIVVGSVRRCGRGRALVNMLTDRYLPNGTRLVFAVTRTDNAIAIAFYIEMGFRVVGVLREFYRDQPGLVRHVDAIMFGKDVGDHANGEPLG